MAFAECEVGPCATGGGRVQLAYALTLRCREQQHAGAALIFQSTSMTKPVVNDLPFAADGTEIEKVWLFFL
jgi:hypothetical protein